MDGMSLAIIRLKKAFEQKENILIYGDYDVMELVRLPYCIFSSHFHNMFIVINLTERRKVMEFH